MSVSFNDTFHFLSNFSPRKAGNAMQVWSSYYASRLAGKPRHKGLPISLAFEPTTSCNLRCPECPSGLRSFTRPTGMLKKELFENVVDQLQGTLAYLTFYFQGEPYLHPQFLEMAAYASKKKIYTATSTNAHYLTEKVARATVESGLSRLIISIDGTNQQTYEAYRVGGSLEKVLEGTRTLIHWKRQLKSSTPHTVFQFLVVKHNEHQIREVNEWARKMGVDEVKLKTAQIYDYKNGSDLMPTLDKYARYRLRKDGTYEIKNELLNHCWKMWQSCVITWDGKVVPCCFDKDAHFILGDVTKNSFEEIWKGEKYNQFRASLLKSRSEIEICKNCSEGLQVWA